MELGFEPHAVMRVDNSIVLADYLRSVPEPDQCCPPSPVPEGGDLLKQSPSLLCLASYYGSLSCLHFLLAQGACVDFRDWRGRSPILFAAIGGNLSALQILRESGGDVNAVDRDGNGIIHFAVMHRRMMILIWAGLATSLPISPRNKRKVTPLHIAATERLPDFVRVLCHWGADPNAKTVYF
jgi:ankyrin repeat protein